MSLPPIPDTLRIDAATLALWRQHASQGRMALTIIDLAEVLDKAELLAQIAAALDFPDYFGANWDALGDCLGDLEVPALSGAGSRAVVFQDWEVFALRSPRDFETLLGVLEDVQVELAGVQAAVRLGVAEASARQGATQQITGDDPA